MYTPVIPALGRLKQEGDSLQYIATPYLKTNQTNKVRNKGHLDVKK
jgi:hypothetical protein